LGEFDQKGGIPTKYGTKQEYVNAVKALQKKGVKVLADVVLNHKTGADEVELVKAKALLKVKPIFGLKITSMMPGAG